MNITELEQSRLNDFKKILTYHLVTKISYHFKNDVTLFYKVPKYWKLFKDNKQLIAGKRNSELRFTKFNPFSLIATFNDAGLDRTQVQAIFGKYLNSTKFIRYKDLIDNDNDINIKKHGMHMSGKKRIQHSNVYLLPYELISSIFNDYDLLNKVKDVGSDYYSDRQRRLIMTQINNTTKNYHYKTNKDEAEVKTQEQLVEELLNDIEL